MGEWGGVNFFIVTFGKNLGSGICVLIFKNRVVAGIMPGKNYFFLPNGYRNDIGQLWPADPRAGPQCTVSVSVAGWGGCNGV